MKSLTTRRPWATLHGSLVNFFSPPRSSPLLWLFQWLLLVFFILIPSGSTLAYSRIISLKPNITEILFALGVGPEVVGVTTYCDRPKKVKKIPKVADYIRVDPEATLRLKPDLIIGSKENSSEKEIDFLRARGIMVELFPFSTIEETLSSINAIGKLLGRGRQAQILTERMQAELAALRRENAGKMRSRVLFVVGYQPLVVAGSDNFLDEASSYLAAVNVAHNSKLKYPVFSTEQAIRAAPEVIIDLSMGSEGTPDQWKERMNWWKQFASIPAVKTHRIRHFEIVNLRAAPDLPQALKDLAKLIRNSAN